MKRFFVIFFLVLFVISGCSASGDNPIEDQNADETGSEPELPPAEQCTTGEEHPIAKNAAETYKELTNYKEIMGWFCEGALFEDIFNALTTEELSGVDAQELLQMLVEGKTWSEIWLELGITQE